MHKKLIMRLHTEIPIKYVEAMLDWIGIKGNRFAINHMNILDVEYSSIVG